MVKKTSYSGDEMKRYLGSLKEHFTDGQKAIGEQYFDLKKDITGLKGDVSGLKEDMVEVKKDMTEVKNTQKSHTQMIGDILVRLEEVKNELKQKVDYKDFAKLQIRVAQLEAYSGRR